MEDKNTIVISLGGSLIVPDEIDTNFVKEFSNFIREYVAKGYKFVIITGGGKICRKYNEALEQIVEPSKQNLDWLGIAVTRLNSEFVRIALDDISYESVVLDPDHIPFTDKPVILSAGWKPGNSSDLAAVHSAISIGSNTVINLSNTDYIYDKDPNKNKDANKFEKLSWDEYLKLIPEEWVPGLSSPFDPIASRKAMDKGIQVVFISGRNIDSFKKYLNGEKFEGTILG